MGTGSNQITLQEHWWQRLVKYKQAWGWWSENVELGVKNCGLLVNLQEALGVRGWQPWPQYPHSPSTCSSKWERSAGCPPALVSLGVPGWQARTRKSSGHPDPENLHKAFLCLTNHILTLPPTHVEKFVFLSYYHLMSNSICYTLLAGALWEHDRINVVNRLFLQLHTCKLWQKLCTFFHDRL